MYGQTCRKDRTEERNRREEAGRKGRQRSIWVRRNGHREGVMNFASMISRYTAGKIMDRRGQPGTVLIPCQVLCALGVLLMAAILALELPVWTMLLAAVLILGSVAFSQRAR